MSTRTPRPPIEPITWRSALAVRPPRPMTVPRSSGCTRTSRRLPRRLSTSRTRTSSGWSTMPLTRCSSAGRSTSDRRGGAVRTLLPGLVGRARLLGGLALELLPVAGLAQQGHHRLAGLGADGQPVLDPVGVDLDQRGFLLRVVGPDVLDGATVALGARVGHDDAVLRVADLPHAEKP